MTYPCKWLWGSLCSVYFNKGDKPFSSNELIWFVQVRLMNHFAPVCNRVLIVCWLVNMLTNGYMWAQPLNVWAEILNAFTSYFFNDTEEQRGQNIADPLRAVVNWSCSPSLHRAEHTHITNGQLLHNDVAHHRTHQGMKDYLHTLPFIPLYVSMICKHRKQRGLSLGPRRCHFITSSERTMKHPMLILYLVHLLHE